VRALGPSGNHGFQLESTKVYALRALVERYTPELAREDIDEDLGQSGASVTKRTGFQKLAAEVSLGKIGAIFLSRSRVSRAPLRTGTGCSISARSRTHSSSTTTASTTPTTSTTGSYLE
jgi:hypothetical protein